MNGYLQFIADVPFDMKYADKEKLGFSSTISENFSEYDEERYAVTARTALDSLYPKEGDNEILRFGPIELSLHYSRVDEHVYVFKETYYWKEAEGLVKYISKKCKKIFQTFELLKPHKKYIHFKTQPFILEIEFLNGLNIVLGFSKNIFKQPMYKMKHTHYSFSSLDKVAEFLPQMKRGMANMYIYASNCKPIHVGHTLAPLLKNVHIDMSVDLEVSHSRNYVVYNPMYIPLSTNSFSNIEVNIRNDAGQLINFPEGSITLLTLHFSKRF